VRQAITSSPAPAGFFSYTTGENQGVVFRCNGCWSFAPGFAERRASVDRGTEMHAVIGARSQSFVEHGVRRRINPGDNGARVVISWPL
jgi:hypothetical protein